MSSKPSSSRNNKIEGVSLDDFHAYMPRHSYIFAPSRDLWPATSVNARVPPIIGPDAKPIPAAKWLDEHAAVEQMTWAPGLPMLIEDTLISAAGSSVPAARYSTCIARRASNRRPATSRRG